MGHILTMVLIAAMAILGGVTSVAMVLALPIVIGWKIYRKIKYGYKLTD